MDFPRMFIYLTSIAVMLINVCTSTEKKSNDENDEKIIEDFSLVYCVLIDNESKTEIDFELNNSDEWALRENNISTEVVNNEYELIIINEDDESDEGSTSNDSGLTSIDEGTNLIEELKLRIPIFLNFFEIISPKLGLNILYMKDAINSIKKSILSSETNRSISFMNTYRQIVMHMLKHIEKVGAGREYELDTLCEKAFEKLNKKYKKIKYKNILNKIKELSYIFKGKYNSLTKSEIDYLLQTVEHIYKQTNSLSFMEYACPSYLVKITHILENSFLKRMHFPLKLTSFYDKEDEFKELLEVIRDILRSMEQSSEDGNSFFDGTLLFNLENILEYLAKSVIKEIRLDAKQFLKWLKNIPVDNLFNGYTLFSLIRYFFVRLFCDFRNTENDLYDLPRNMKAVVLFQIWYSMDKEESILLSACEEAIYNYKLKYQSNILREGSTESFLAVPFMSLKYYKLSLLCESLLINYTYFLHIYHLQNLLKEGLEVSKKKINETFPHAKNKYKVYVKTEKKKEIKETLMQFEKIITFTLEELDIQNKINELIAVSYSLQYILDTLREFSKSAIIALAKLQEFTKQVRVKTLMKRKLVIKHEEENKIENQTDNGNDTFIKSKEENYCIDFPVKKKKRKLELEEKQKEEEEEEDEEEEEETDEEKEKKLEKEEEKEDENEEKLEKEIKQEKDVELGKGTESEQKRNLDEQMQKQKKVFEKRKEQQKEKGKKRLQEKTHEKKKVQQETQVKLEQIEQEQIDQEKQTDQEQIDQEKQIDQAASTSASASEIKKDRKKRKEIKEKTKKKRMLCKKELTKRSFLALFLLEKFLKQSLLSCFKFHDTIYNFS